MISASVERDAVEGPHRSCHGPCCTRFLKATRADGRTKKMHLTGSSHLIGEFAIDHLSGIFVPSDLECGMDQEGMVSDWKRTECPCLLGLPLISPLPIDPPPHRDY